MDSTTRKHVQQLVDSGANNNVIANIVSAQSNIGINYRQIQHIRDDTINSIFEDREKNPKSSVDELIALFASMNDISYVYMIHSKTSGFVTYHKTKIETDIERSRIAKLSDQDKKALAHMTPDEKKELEVWRNTL